MPKPDIFHWLRIKLWAAKLWNTTLCSECYRGRISIAVTAGALLSMIVPAWAVAIAGILSAGIFAGRKHNWWMPDPISETGPPEYDQATPDPIIPDSDAPSIEDKK